MMEIAPVNAPIGLKLDKPEEVAGRDTAIEITALGISLPMAEIFRGIGTA